MESRKDLLGLKDDEKLKEAYDNIEKLNSASNSHEEQLNKAKERLGIVEKMMQQSNEQLEITRLKKHIEEQEKVIREYQDLNQKLFLKIGMPVDEKPEETMMNPEERAFKEQIAELDKRIKEENEKESKGE